MKLPEKIFPVNYAGFFDFAEDGLYNLSVINQDDYENAEEIANEISRRYNNFPKWIDLKEHQPEYMDVVIVRTSIGIITQMQYGGDNSFYNGGDWIKDVTHWQPLPIFV